MMEPFDDTIDKWFVAGTKRPMSGFDGTKISRELGFEYQYPDPRVTLVDSAQSFVDLGIADGSAKLRPAAVVFVGSVAVVLLAAAL